MQLIIGGIGIISFLIFTLLTAIPLILDNTKDVYNYFFPMIFIFGGLAFFSFIFFLMSFHASSSLKVAALHSDGSTNDGHGEHSVGHEEHHVEVAHTSSSPEDQSEHHH